MAKPPRDEVNVYPGEGIPAVFSNRFHVYNYGDTVRLVFGDQIADAAPKFSSSMMISRADAVELAKLIMQIVLGSNPPIKPAADGEIKEL